MFVALAKLSLGGGGAATLKVTGCDFPPPGGGFNTVMSLVLPYGPSSAAGRVAVRLGLLLNFAAIPFCAPLKNTFSLLEKTAPVHWMGTLVVGVGVCTGVVAGFRLGRGGVG